jgi:hypothetical protein
MVGSNPPIVCHSDRSTTDEGENVEWRNPENLSYRELIKAFSPTCNAPYGFYNFAMADLAHTAINKRAG